MTDAYAGTGGGIYQGARASDVPMNEEPAVTPRKIREMWDRGVRSIRHERNQAALNEQFLRNRHWLHMNPTTGRLEELPRNPERVRASIARIGPDSHRILAKLTQRPLTFEVPPNSPDDAAIMGAKVGEAALHQQLEEDDWEDLRYDFATSTWTGGTAGICVEWDDQVGEPIGVNRAGRLIRTGAPKLTVVDLHEICFEPGVRDPEHSYWWIRAQALPPAVVKTHYQLDVMPEPDARAIDAIWRLSDGERHEHTPLTMVYTYFERPNHGKPGQIITTVNDEIVQTKPWYFPFDDRLNIATCVVWPIHGRWFGHTPVSDAVPIQSALNASWSSIIEHMKQAGNARLFYPHGGLDDPEDLSDLAGEAVPFSPIQGQRPEYASPPVMPQWWIQQPGMLGNAMDDVLGGHDVSRGQAPTGLESGIALSQLIEEDSTPVGRFNKNMGATWGRVASMILKLYEAFVSETRQSLVYQPYSKIPEVIQWSGNTLQGQTTAIVPPESLIPRGRNAQMAYAFQMQDRGFIQDPIALARVADLPNQSELVEGLSPDTGRAMRENAEMATGVPRTIEHFDNHENHIAIIRDFMRSSRFEHLEPQVQQIFRNHLAAHEQYAAALMAQQMQAASVSPAAAAMPNANDTPLDTEALQQAIALSAMAPSAATMGAPNAPMLGQGAPSAGVPPAPVPTPGGGGPGSAALGPPPPAPVGATQQMTNELIEDTPAP